MAKSIASTLSSVFGGEVSYFHTGQPIQQINAVIRKDVELLDDHGQVVGRVTTLRIAHDDILNVPVRGDTVLAGAITYTLGKRLADDGFAYVFEATT